MDLNNVIDRVFPSLTGYMLTIYRFYFIELGYIYSINSIKMVGYFPEVFMNVKRSFLKVDRFISKLAVGHPCSLVVNTLSSWNILLLLMSV